MFQYNVILAKNKGGFSMRKIKELLFKKVDAVMENFALAFAGGSVQRICYYIFHQPKMPEDVMNMNEK